MLFKTEKEVRAEIVDVCLRIYRNGWVASNDGNVSVLIEDNVAICTPTGVSKGDITPDMLIKVDIDGNKLEGEKELKPSSEIKMHLDILKNKEGVNSVVHAHPPFSTAFAVAGVLLDECILPEIVISLGQIPLTKYGTPSTFEIPENVREHLKDNFVFLLENHGALSTGSDVYQAYYRMESMELFAKINFLARQIGKVNVIDENNVKKLLKLRSEWGMDTENYPGCRIGDRVINYSNLENNKSSNIAGDDNTSSSNNNVSIGLSSSGSFLKNIEAKEQDDKIILTKKQLTEIVETVVKNILKEISR